MTAFKSALSLIAIFGISLLVTESHCSQRVKRTTPVQHEVYALDHFIELVEKIEVNVTELYLVADHIRSLVSKDDYWNYVIGEPKPLPDGILTSDELNVLTKMVSHKYDGSRELGVVRTSSGETIAIGSLMTGIMAGIERKKDLSLKEWVSGTTKNIDNLYAATISRNLAATTLAKKNTPANDYFGPGGSWDDDHCPEIYTKTSNSAASKASYAQLLGDVDGFILGSKITSWARDSRLGQILRMYYSTGICFDNSYASCKRYEKLESITNKNDLAVQVEGVAEAIYLKNNASYGYPNVNSGDILSISKDVAEKFFPKIENVAVEHKCQTTASGCELPANLVFLMDESGSITSEHFKQQKKFVNQIIDVFNISPRQTKVALIQFGTKATIEFNFDRYGSKTRLKCAIEKTTRAKGYTNTAGAIDLARKMFLDPLQEQASTQSERSNIVILLTDGKSNTPTESAIYPAIKKIKSDVKELTTISVGVGRQIDTRELRSFAKDSDHVSTAIDFDKLLTLVKALQNQTCSTPLQLNLQFNQEGNTTFVDFFITPGKKRFFTLPSKFFFDASIILQITPKYGRLRLFASRTISTPSPDNKDYQIDPIPEGQSLQLVINDACNGANSSDFCPPLYLGIYAEGTKCTCTEKKCFLPGQIKFRIEKGVRQPSASNKPAGQLFFIFVVAGFALIQTLFSELLIG